MRSDPHPVDFFLHGIVGRELMAARHLEELLRCEWPQLRAQQPTIPLGRHGTSLAKSKTRKEFAGEGCWSFYCKSRSDPITDRSLGSTKSSAFFPCGARLPPS